MLIRNPYYWHIGTLFLHPALAHTDPEFLNHAALVPRSLFVLIKLVVYLSASGHQFMLFILAGHSPCGCAPGILSACALGFYSWTQCMRLFIWNSSICALGFFLMQCLGMHIWNSWPDQRIHVGILFLYNACVCTSGILVHAHWDSLLGGSACASTSPSAWATPVR